MKPQPATSNLQCGQWSVVPLSGSITSEPAALLRLSPWELLPNDVGLSLDVPRLRTPLDHLPDPRCPAAPPPPPPPCELFRFWECLVELLCLNPPCPQLNPFPLSAITIESNVPLSLLERTELESPPTLPPLVDVPCLFVDAEERCEVFVAERWE